MLAGAKESSRVSATVSVDGRRWRRLASAHSLATATKDAQVFILDADSGAVRFGDGKHGALPPPGSRVRVNYRQASGAGGATASWAAEWPPRPFAIAEALVPRALTDHCD